MKFVFLIILSSLQSLLIAQQGYNKNDIAIDFPIDKILNYSSSSARFQQLNEKLLVVDFFGTWCIPCIKALPKLTALQQKYKESINIILVSEEAEVKLQSFIKKQENFIFPVIVDEQEKFKTLFQPPSYPYTVIIGKDGKVLAIPLQEEMTDENIKLWLTEKSIINSNVVTRTNATINDDVPLVNNKTVKEVEKSQNKLVQLSQDFMYAAKTGDETAGFISLLSSLNMQELTSTIKSDDEKKAFWINLYNAYTQAALKKNPEQYKNRGAFFGEKKIAIAGKKFSLDDIEHGILRRSKIKWSLGYLNKIFPGKTEKQLRVNTLDYRLHFALNCGAKSCPPIAFYKPETINSQLDLATNAYLTGEAEYDAVANTVKLPALMSWFRRDFGGKRKMIKLLKQLSIIPVDKKPTIQFKSYDWTLYLQNYKS